MSVKATGIAETKLALSRIGDRMFDRQLVYLRQVTKDIQDLAQDFAPVDDGFLEKSIEVEEEKGDRNRIVIFVGVNPDLLGEGYSRYGARYDEIVHEFMDTPTNQMGFIKRGEKTLAKSPDAGGKFLERAFDAFEDEIHEEMVFITETSLR